MPEIREILKRYRRGEMEEDELLRELRLDYVENVAGVLFDYSRHVRKGIPEIVYCPGKSLDILKALLHSAMENAFQRIFSKCPQEFIAYAKSFEVRVNEDSSMVSVNPYSGDNIGGIAIFSAGHSDLLVAEEAAFVAEEMGCEVLRYYDVGVAGIHRLKDPLKEVVDSDVVCAVCVAGMEGILPSLLASLLPIPVIGVPTSVGYGVAREGKAALNTMLSSCSPGLVVVNIDNGVGAGMVATLIAIVAHRGKSKRKDKTP